MRIMLVVLLAVLVGALAVGCSQDQVTVPAENLAQSQASDLNLDPDRIASEIILATGWDLAEGVDKPASLDLLENNALSKCLFGFERTVLMGDIVHYSFEFPIGDGPYEMIRLHRVVRETRPNQPIKTRKNLFALHGNPGNFPMMFLFGTVAPNVPDELALAVFLAQQDVDVWGIDRSVNFVPLEETDFSFMADWGLQFNVDALRAGMAVARITRRSTGGGPAPMNLLGYSTGLTVGFATVNHEAALPKHKREVGGLIVVDNHFKADPGPWQERACAEAQIAQEQLASGQFSQPIGALFNNLGYLARTYPDGTSPIVPGFTNQGAALFAGALTWMIFDPPAVPPVHFFAGVFDEESGLPVDLAFTEYEHYLDFLMLAQPYNATAMNLDSGMVGCDQVDVPFDDFLDQVTVPVMYVGAAGGIAPTGDRTLEMLGSNDVTLLTPQFYPPEATLLDIGHVDIFTSQVAVDLVWQPILDWVEAHPGGHGPGGQRPHAPIESGF
jgi:hypothetical protein